MGYTYTFKSNMKQVQAAMEASMKRGLTKACQLVEAQAAALAPVDTDNLRSSITYKVSKEDGKSVGIVGTPVHYAVHQEYGTGEFAENGRGRKGGWSYIDEEGVRHFTMGTKPKKFLKKAFDKNKKNIQTVIEAELTKGLK